MMLLNPSAGEVCDRITILELKILNSGQRDTTEWAKEHEELILFLRPQSSGVGNKALEESYESLQVVNKQLWEAEDELRAYPDENEIEFQTKILAIARCAKKIARLNDERMKLVKEINTLFNQKDAAEGAQKIYSGVKA